jgi:hypothetical protein
MMIFVEDEAASRLVGRNKRAHNVTAKMTDILLPSFFLCQRLAAGRSHLITLSARNNTDWGIVRPSYFAVLTLMTSSNFVPAQTEHPPAAH